MGFDTSNSPVATPIDPRTGQPYVNPATGQPITVGNNGSVDYDGKYGTPDGFGGGLSDVGGVDIGGLAGDLWGAYKTYSPTGRVINLATGGKDPILSPLIDKALGTGAGGGIASPELAAAIANSRSLQDQYNVPVTPRTAPSAVAAEIGPVERAQQQAAIQAQQIQAAKIAGYQAANEVGPIQAGTVTAGLSNAAQAGRTTLGPTELAAGTKLGSTALADQSIIDALKQNEFRQGQTGLVTDINNTIAGKDPSVAAIMLRQATDRNIANQYALAAAANGQNSGIASYNAARNVADLNQQAAGQQALLRAQEIATARGQLGSVLSSGRESDIGLATNQAGLAQQVALANAGFTNTANMNQAQLDQAIKLANAGFKNTATTTQAQLDQATSTLNANLANATGIANAGNVTQANVSTAGNQTSAANTAASLNAAIRQTNATNQSNANTNQAKLEQEASTTNAGNNLTASKSTAELDQQVALANALAANKAAETNANNQTGVNTANLSADVQTNAQNITDKQNAASNTLTASGQQVQAAAAKASADAAAAKAANDQSNRNQDLLIKGVTAIASSDRQKKKSIRRADADIVALLKGIKPYGFRYKDPEAPGAASGKRFGVMAQDLEKSKAGRTLVHNTPSGKVVDVNQAVLTALAGLGNVNKRLETVEKRKSA